MTPAFEDSGTMALDAEVGTKILVGCLLRIVSVDDLRIGAQRLEDRRRRFGCDALRFVSTPHFSIEQRERGESS